MKPNFLYRAMMACFRFRGWSTFVKVAVIALIVSFALETLGLSIFWLNGGGF
jgi:hypothetical protein